MSHAGSDHFAAFVGKLHSPAAVERLAIHCFSRLARIADAVKVVSCITLTCFGYYIPAGTADTERIPLAVIAVAVAAVAAGAHIDLVVELAAVDVAAVAAAVPR